MLFPFCYVILFIMSESGDSPRPIVEDLSVAHLRQAEVEINGIKQDEEPLRRVQEVGSLLAAETNVERLQHLNILRDTMTPAEAAQTLALGVRGGKAADKLSYNINYALDAVGGAFGRARQAVSPEGTYTLSETDRQQVSDLFAAIQENFDWMGNSDFKRGQLSGGLHGLLNQNPELKDLGEKLITEVDRGIPERLISQVTYIAPETPVADIHRMIDRGTAREVATGIERFRFISRVLAKLPDGRRQVVRDQLNQAFVNSPDTARRAGILGALFEATESQQLTRQLNRVGATIEDIPEIFADDAIVEIISVMADNPAEYRFQLGALLTQISVNQLPNSIGEKLKPIITDAELKLKSENGTWWLCGMAEPRLKDAVKDGALMLVNDRLLLKFNGKLSALCLESFTTSGGTVFLEGNWYSPTDNTTRLQLRSQFDQGHARVRLTTGEWTIMRPLDKDGIERRSRFWKTPDKLLNNCRIAYRIELSVWIGNLTGMPEKKKDNWVILDEWQT